MTDRVGAVKSNCCDQTAFYPELLGCLAWEAWVAVTLYMITIIICIARLVTHDNFTVCST